MHLIFHVPGAIAPPLMSMGLVDDEEKEQERSRRNREITAMFGFVGTKQSPQSLACYA
jgi:hypothetical protein